MLVRVSREGPFGRPRCKWERNSKMDLCEMWFESVGWIQLIQDMDLLWNVVKTIMNFPIP